MYQHTAGSDQREPPRLVLRGFTLALHSYIVYLTMHIPHIAQ